MVEQSPSVISWRSSPVTGASGQAGPGMQRSGWARELQAVPCLHPQSPTAQSAGGPSPTWGQSPHVLGKS